LKRIIWALTWRAWGKPKNHSPDSLFLWPSYEPSIFWIPIRRGTVEL